MTEFGSAIVARIAQLAAISESPSGLTRLFLTPQHRRAADLLMDWMRDAGMTARCDAIGNVVGRYEGAAPGAPCLMLGSHMDSVRDAGRWDGPLGIVTAIACVADLNARGVRYPFAIDVVSFADEEGARFEAALLGSRAVAGTFDPAVLDVRDVQGIAMRDALTAFGLDPADIGTAARRKQDVLAYLELHIEQGPVLERVRVPVGIVTGIAGATRLTVTLTGEAGHAGTVPMALRHDALAGAAACILAVETYCAARDDVVGTVGRIAAQPGAGNVIPGAVKFSLDVRSGNDAIRLAAVDSVTTEIARIAARRGLVSDVQRTHENIAAPCDPALRALVAEAVAAEGYRVQAMASGAGHDGMAMIALCPIGMIFVRCRGGISHNPAEHVEMADADAGARVMLRTIELFAAAR